MNKSSLLNQLRISREEEKSRAVSWPWLTAGGVTIVLVLVALIWLQTRSEGVAVRATEAQAISSETEGTSLLDASGYVVARRAATVSAKITGKVVNVLIEEGDHVAEGQVIARLDDSNARAALNLAMASLEAAKYAAADIRPIYLRNERLQGAGFVSREAYDTAKTNFDAARANLEIARRSLEIAQTNLDDTIIRAPFDGIVTEKAAQPGEIVSPVSAGSGFTRTGIATIVDMNSLEVDVDVAESFINRVRNGMPATVTLNAYPDWSIPADVIAVVPTADRSKATVSVRIGLKAKDPRIVPEMGARVSFLDTGTQLSHPLARAVIVPLDAVTHDNAGVPVVFVIAGHKVERRAVRLGARRTDGQIIIAGLRAGESVAETDSGRLVDGDTVRVTQGSTN